MKTLRKLLLGALVFGALSVPATGAVARPAGGPCVVTGSGTSFDLNVTGPASSQGGVAVGIPGWTVTGISIPGFPGTTGASGLPPNTSLEFFSSSPLPPGRSFDINVTTSGSVAVGSIFNVVPINEAHDGYLPPLLCPFLSDTAPTGGGVGNDFTPSPKVAYDPRTGEYYDLVKRVSGPGNINWSEVRNLSPRSLAAAKAQNAAKPLIQSGKVVVKQAGDVKLTLRPTAAGRSALKQKGFLKFRLKITFSPTGGTPASKIVSLTLPAK